MAVEVPDVAHGIRLPPAGVPLVCAIALLSLANCGCGLSNSWQTKRQPRLIHQTEAVVLDTYSYAPGVVAPPTVLDAIQRTGKPLPQPKVSTPQVDEQAVGPTNRRVFPAVADDPAREALANAVTARGAQDVEDQTSVETPPAFEDGKNTEIGGVDPATMTEPPIGPRQAMTLEDARVAALIANLDLQVVKYNPGIQEQQVRQEAWKFESTFQGVVQRNEVNPPAPIPIGPPLGPVSSIYANTLPFPLITNTFNPGLNIPFTTGGSLILSETLTQRSYNVGSPSPTFYDLAPTLTLTQPLLRGAGFYVNMAPIRFSQLQLGRVDAQTKLTAIQVLAAIEQAYWNLYGTQKLLEISLQQIDLAKTQVANAVRLREAGVVSNVEVLRSVSGLQLRKQVAVNARLQVKLANRQLKQLMQAADTQVDTPIEIEPISIPNLIGLKLDRDALADKAIANRLELLDLALQLEQNRLTANVAKNQTLPKVDFQFQGQLLGLGTSYGQSSSQAWDGGSTTFFAGLNFSQGLALNQSARANYSQACLNLARTAAEQQRTRITILKETNDAIDNFDQNWQAILVAQEAVRATQQTFEAESKLFQLGQRASDLVLISASNLASAQQQLVQSVVNYQISRVGIALATGTVLGYATLEPAAVKIAPDDLVPGEIAPVENPPVETTSPPAMPSG
jgi:outer membrane protein TolC